MYRLYLALISNFFDVNPLASGARLFSTVRGVSDFIDLIERAIS
jgi:hypothetical protein